MIGFPGIQHDPSAITWQPRRSAPVMARGGMVASAHPLATEAGLRTLASGGNAVDAAISAALAATVVLPAMCGIGGDLFVVMHAPDGSGGEAIALQGSGIAPRNATIEQMREYGPDNGRCMPQQGPLSVAVPGAVDGYFSLLERFGTRPFAELAEPAIGYAADGFPLNPQNARIIADSADLLGQFASSSAVFLPDGRAPEAGSIFRQEDLGRTLRQIADGGPDVFYRGDIARRVGEYMAKNGGALAADDFADHATDISDPLTTTYRGHTIYETNLPTQGMIVLEGLNIVENADLSDLGVNSGGGVHLQAEALKLGFADRLAYAGDPATIDTPLGTMLSKAFAADRFKQIDANQAARDVPAGAMSAGDTTYLCVIDGNGMMVSLIQSLSAGFGSGVIAGDTGMMLNNRAGHCFSLVDGHPNLFAPGKKTMHTLNCYMIADPDGTPIIVGGTPGGDGQPQWNIQMITGLLDAGYDVQTAVEQPRWTVWPGTYPIEVGNPFELRVEDQLGDAAIAELEGKGHQIRRVGPWASGGAAQIIARDPETGVLAGGSDPRAEGLALGY